MAETKAEVLFLITGSCALARVLGRIKSKQSQAAGPVGAAQIRRHRCCTDTQSVVELLGLGIDDPAAQLAQLCLEPWSGCGSQVEPQLALLRAGKCLDLQGAALWQ